MNLRFYFTQQMPSRTEGSLFAAEYRLPTELRRLAGQERIAIVDDCISAGSSVRATEAELTAAGASAVVVGTILLLGNQAVEHFSVRGVPVVALDHQKFNLWPPAECPLCRTGAPLENPITSHGL
jgi:orotate phosphoribosyltransferase